MPGRTARFGDEPLGPPLERVLCTWSSTALDDDLYGIANLVERQLAMMVTVQQSLLATSFLGNASESVRGPRRDVGNRSCWRRFLQE